MYSGTTLTTKSGRIMGVHQKIDRVARRHLQTLLPDDFIFPNIKDILHFEGQNGPDGIKRKSPAVDEPWHFIDPHDVDDVALIEMIEEHIANLAKALRDGSQKRAAFEAAWLAHAVTDGLTPAHHFPLESALEELRGGEGLDSRTSVLKKGMMTGDTTIEKIRNNWRFWGAKGIMTTHFSFEAGIASVIAYRKFNNCLPGAEMIEKLIEHGFRKVFLDSVGEVSELDMYNNFIKTGWTTTMAKQTNEQLMPIIIKAVTLGWLQAAWMSSSEAKLK